MKTRLINAINELSKYYEEFRNLHIKEVMILDNTFYKDGIMYLTSINHALLYLTNYINNSTITIDPHFNTFGTMIDLSRNAVFTVDYLKDVIRKQALLGINKIMLYTEDTYEVKDEPYFGYMRGRYTQEEIKEIVAYADIFAIEVIPCIQTLGHLGQFLRWGYNGKLKDQQTVLMTEIDEVYEFIERCISSLREAYQTNKIHIGLDETFGFGLGRFYKQFGFKDQYTLFIRHLKRVNQICLKYNFNDVMIWSDMFFRISSVKEEYYDVNVNIAENIKKNIPENVSLVYWDYYNYNKSIVDAMINKHLEITPKTIMASGTWIWTKLVYDKVQTDKTALVHIAACKDLEIKDLYFTQWNDDGAPCNYETVFLGLFDMSNKALVINSTMTDTVYQYIMNNSYQEARLIVKLNEAPINPLSLLWDDPLLGIYLNNEQIKNPLIINEGITFFKQYINELELLNMDNFEIKHTEIISKLLLDKLEIRKELLEAYHHKKSLSNVISLCENAMEDTENLLLSYRKMWLSRYKAFGLDVIQSRLATLKYRFKETILRIKDYENHLIKQIDELEEKVGPYQYIRMNHMYIAYSSIHVLSY